MASAQDSILIIVIAIILARVAWRTLASYRGARFSLQRTYFYTGIYVFIGVVFSALSYIEGVPYDLVVPEIILAALAGAFAYRYTDRRISFWKDSEGMLYFKGGVFIYLVYLVALSIRVAIDLVYLGPSAFALNTTAVLTGGALYATMATDLLLTFGIGLLIGRGARVARRYGMIERGEEKVPDSPPGHA